MPPTWYGEAETDAPNARSSGRAAERAAERGTELPGQRVPGTSLVMHRFDAGAGPLASVPWVDLTGGLVHDGPGGIPGRSLVSELSLALANWMQDQRLASTSSVFNRNAYVAPDNVFEQMRIAQEAVENDDTVGGIADATEGLTFEDVHWEAPDSDDADIFNQHAEQVDLDSLVRMCFRELFTVSQYVLASWWGFRDFKVRGNGPPKVDPQTGELDRDTVTRRPKRGRPRRKTYNQVYCPLAFTMLDSTKVLPLGSLMFGKEKLVWTATEEEVYAWTQIQSGAALRTSDPIVSRLFVDRYTPTDAERRMIAKLSSQSGRSVDVNRLLVLNPAYVWRHTLTRPSYRPWADVRLKRIFRWLDLKQQLMAADRVALVGNANYILLVTQGDEKNPAKQEELDELNQRFAYVAKLPVIIGPHTLQIQIITPKQEFTLEDSRYAVIEAAITRSLLHTFRAEGTRGSAGDNTLMVVRAIARGLGNRRKGQGRDLEARIGRAVVEHPFNEGKFTGPPNLAFSPRNVQLDMDSIHGQAVLAFLARGDLSRETGLEEFGFDAATEVQRREREQVEDDPIMRSATPHDSPANNPRSGDTGQGGLGGGALPPGQGGGGRPPAGPARAKRAARGGTT